MKGLIAVFVSLVTVLPIFEITSGGQDFMRGSNAAYCEKILQENIMLAKRGCCSKHNGVCGCKDGRVVCCDGSISPSCTCDSSGVDESLYFN